MCQIEWHMEHVYNPPALPWSEVGPLNPGKLLYYVCHLFNILSWCNKYWWPYKCKIHINRISFKPLYLCIYLMHLIVKIQIFFHLLTNEMISKALDFPHVQYKLFGDVGKQVDGVLMNGCLMWPPFLSVLQSLRMMCSLWLAVAICCFTWLPGELCFSSYAFTTQHQKSFTKRKKIPQLNKCDSCSRFAGCQVAIGCRQAGG